MQDDEDRSATRTRRKKDPFPWFKFRVAEILAHPGVAMVWGDNDALAAMMRFAAHSWLTGPIADEALEAVCGSAAGANKLRALLLERCDGGWRMRWLEAARSEADRTSKDQSERRSGRPGSTPVNPGQPRSSDADHKTRREETREEESEKKSGEKRARASRAPKAERGGGTPSTRHWDAEWSRTRPVAWSWQAKDFAALGKCLELAGGDHAEVCRRISILLASSDGFHLKAASPGLLLSQWPNLGFQVVKPNKASEGASEIQRQLEDFIAKNGGSQ